MSPRDVAWRLCGGWLVRIVKGTEIWNEYGRLNEPLKVLGVERSVFVMVLSFSVGVFVALEALLLSVVSFGVFWGLGRAAMAHDENFMRVVRATMKNRGGWFDPGLLESTAWVVEVVESERGRGGD
ncbi:MAG: VirB3 family type IV secretion system protein [Acidobacteria bacterium]|nr:VirB3 family type IV secretion system protein [Acidobacteriota bacterium]